jgi:hypothetical protein
MTFTKTQKQRIADYFAYHGDTHVRVMKRLPSRYNVPVALVHVTNRAGVPYSVIVTEDSDGDWFELASAERAKADAMLKWYEESEDEDDE